MTGDSAILRALAEYEGLDAASVEPLGSGLINDTYLVRAGSGLFVLQRVSSIFDPRIHDNILAVTERLAEAGVSTPRLVATRSGARYVDGEAGVYRLMTHVAGRSFDVVQSLEQARSAGRLVARFHSALDGLGHDFVGLRVGVHDTSAHMERLRDSLEQREEHRLHAAVAPLGRSVLERARELPPLPALPNRVCHGDLKFNNLLFAGDDPPDRDRAICLIDLDTLGPLHLGYELGDAWRSWCNLAGENQAEAELDLAVLDASLDGYLEARALSPAERQALLVGPELASLELVARFARDALEESYFGWDQKCYASAGEHNLVRARGQWSLHEAFIATRVARARSLGLDSPSMR